MGLVYLYTGSGAGKTTSALGLALRSLGHNQKVTIIQFLKGWKNIGEYKIRKKLSPLYEIHQFNRGRSWVNLKNPSEKDKQIAQKGLKFVEKTIKKAPHLLILDEINLACYAGLIKTEDVLRILKNIPKRTTVVLTGRYAPKELIDRADFVNEIIDIKHPKKIPTTRGIQY